jgi:hypothetical protein
VCSAWAAAEIQRDRFLIEKYTSSSEMAMPDSSLNKPALMQSNGLELNAQVPVLVFLVEVVRSHDIGFPWTNTPNHPKQS